MLWAGRGLAPIYYRPVNHAFSEFADRDVGVLRELCEQFEGPHGVEVEPFHEDAFGLSDVISTGKRGSELLLGVGRGEGDRGVGSQHRCQGFGFRVEYVWGPTEQVERPRTTAVSVQMKRQHAVDAQFGCFGGK